MREKIHHIINRLKQINKKTMVCYGTSLTSGSGWVKMLQKELPDWCVINSGEGGMNSNWGVDNFEKKVLRYSPHVVLMEFSINDCFIGEPLYEKPQLNKSLSNIKNMIKRLRWSKVYYMTMNNPLDIYLKGRNPAEQRPLWETYYRRHRLVAKELGAEIINHTPMWEVLDQGEFLRLCSDGLHPCEQGSKEITLPTILGALCLK